MVGNADGPSAISLEGGRNSLFKAELAVKLLVSEKEQQEKHVVQLEEQLKDARKQVEPSAIADQSNSQRM